MNDIKILVVEDDREINQLLEKYLSKEGYEVISAYNGREALELLKAQDIKFVVLDLMIPYIDGYEVLRKIRSSGNIPVLILSAKNEETDKIIGLGLGADDFMTKPFSIFELVARVKAQLRRFLQLGNLSSETSILKHLDMELNLTDYSVNVSGKNITLTSKEFEILKLFILNPKKVFTKNQIFNSVWREDFILGENTVMVHIRRLREKIEPDPSNPKYIQTVWGIGYKLSEV